MPLRPSTLARPSGRGAAPHVQPVRGRASGDLAVTVQDRRVSVSGDWHRRRISATINNVGDDDDSAAASRGGAVQRRTTASYRRPVVVVVLLSARERSHFI